MYYTTSGAYRKSKMLIDYATIALTAVIMILFILILFLRSNSGILFPIVFLAGALINGLSGIKAFMNKKRLSGVFLIIAVVLVRYLMDDTIKTPEDVEKYLQLSTLAVIPLNEGEADGKKKKKKVKRS